MTFAHVFYGGHVIPMFADQSYFAPTEKAGQALVDEVISKPGYKGAEVSRAIYSVNMGRVVGMPTQWVTMIVERNNCSSTWRFNEVVTMYPDRERP